MAAETSKHVLRIVLLALLSLFTVMLRYGALQDRFLQRPCPLSLISSVAVSEAVVAVSPKPLDLTFRSCALVGASSALTGRGRGREIDAHDVVIRVNRLPISKYATDFGQRTDVFFAHDKNVQADGFSIQYMDGAWHSCGTWPNRTHCGDIGAFIWSNLPWNDWMVQNHSAVLAKSTGAGVFVGATQLGVCCAASLLLNRMVDPPEAGRELATGWRWLSTGFVAFLTFGHICETMDVYGFSGADSADKSHGEVSSNLKVHNYIREHELMHYIVQWSHDWFSEWYHKHHFIGLDENSIVESLRTSTTGLHRMVIEDDRTAQEYSCQSCACRGFRWLEDNLPRYGQPCRISVL